MEYSIHSNISQTENENENSNTLDNRIERKKVKKAFKESEHAVRAAVVAEGNPLHTLFSNYDSTCSKWF